MYSKSKALDIQGDYKFYCRLWQWGKVEQFLLNVFSSKHACFIWEEWFHKNTAISTVFSIQKFSLFQGGNSNFRKEWEEKEGEVSKFTIFSGCIWYSTLKIIQEAFISFQWDKQIHSETSQVSTTISCFLDRSNDKTT